MGFYILLLMQGMFISVSLSEYQQVMDHQDGNMVLEALLKGLLPKSYSLLDQAIALTVIKTSLAISLAMLLLVLYWVFTKSFETVKTIIVVLGVILILALCIRLEMTGRISAGAWTLIAVTVLLNFASMAVYGISSSASSAYVLPILLAFFCVGSTAGYAITIAGCIFVFAIPILSSKGWIHTIFPYQASNITFEAPSLSLIYLIIALITGSWNNSMKVLF